MIEAQKLSNAALPSASATATDWIHQNLGILAYIGVALAAVILQILVLATADDNGDNGLWRKKIAKYIRIRKVSWVVAGFVWLTAGAALIILRFGGVASTENVSKWLVKTVDKGAFSALFFFSFSVAIAQTLIEWSVERSWAGYILKKRRTVWSALLLLWFVTAVIIALVLDGYFWDTLDGARPLVALALISTFALLMVSWTRRAIESKLEDVHGFQGPLVRSFFKLIQREFAPLQFVIAGPRHSGKTEFAHRLRGETRQSNMSTATPQFSVLHDPGANYIVSLCDLGGENLGDQLYQIKEFRCDVLFIIIDLKVFRGEEIIALSHSADVGRLINTINRNLQSADASMNIGEATANYLTALWMALKRNNNDTIDNFGVRRLEIIFNYRTEVDAERKTADALRTKYNNAANVGFVLELGSLLGMTSRSYKNVSVLDVHEAAVGRYLTDHRPANSSQHSGLSSFASGSRIILNSWAAVRGIFRS